MRPAPRPLLSVFVRYLVRFLLPASVQRKAAPSERSPQTMPTYPTGNARPVALDSLTTRI